MSAFCNVVRRSCSVWSASVSSAAASWRRYWSSSAKRALNASGTTSGTDVRVCVSPNSGERQSSVPAVAVMRSVTVVAQRRSSWLYRVNATALRRSGSAVAAGVHDGLTRTDSVCAQPLRSVHEAVKSSAPVYAVASIRASMTPPRAAPSRFGDANNVVTSSRVSVASSADGVPWTDSIV